MVWGGEGTGKTRASALDLARAYHRPPWPDGQADDTCPPNQSHSGSVAMAIKKKSPEPPGKMGLLLDAILFNASPEDPCTGVDLDEPCCPSNPWTRSSKSRSLPWSSSIP